MNRLILSVLILLSTLTPAFCADYYTTHYNLVVPEEGSRNWTAKLSADMVSIDTALWSFNPLLGTNTTVAGINTTLTGHNSTFTTINASISSINTTLTSHNATFTALNTTLYNWNESAIEAVISGGGSAITIGNSSTRIEVPFNATITSATLMADTANNMVVDIWRDAYANYPPTVADTICGGGKLTLSAAIASQDNTLGAWNKTLNKGDILIITADSVTSIKEATVSLKVLKR